jgi:hypothetical protein
MRRTFTFLMVVLLGWGGTAFSQTPTLTFSMANATITGTAPNQKLEFDILMACNQAGTYHSGGLPYVDYSSAAFGINVVANGNLVFNGGALLPSTKYLLFLTQDNSATTFARSYASVTPPPPFVPFMPGNFEEIPTSPTVGWHVELDIANINSTAGLSFNQTLMNGQFFYATTTGQSPYNLAFGADYSTLNLSTVPQLPLEGLSLQAIPGNRSITLDWTIEREINNKGFFVQRSADGENYAQLGWIDGAGDARNTRYSFIDNSVGPNKTYYYRLKQVDIDGTVHFSPVIQSRIEAHSHLFVEVAPNPVTGKEAVIKLTMPEEGSARYTITDNAGKTVTSGSWSDLERGTSGHRIPVNVATGLYHVSVTDGIRKADALMLVK